MRAYYSLFLKQIGKVSVVLWFEQVVILVHLRPIAFMRTINYREQVHHPTLIKFQLSGNSNKTLLEPTLHFSCWTYYIYFLLLFFLLPYI